MRARHAYAILCLYGALISVELPMAGCAHRGGALDIQDPNAVRRFQLEKIALRTPVMVELHDGKVERGSYNGRRPAGTGRVRDALRGVARAAGPRCRRRCSDDR